MINRSYNPLACIPSPEVVRRKLHETEALAARLRILPDLERLHTPNSTAATRLPVTPLTGKEVARR
jgi:hypothetical protein